MKIYMDAACEGREPERDQARLEAAKGGDREAMDSLFADYEPLIRAAARRRRYLGEDAYGAAALSFLLAIHSFDVSRGVHFPAFAKAKLAGDLKTLSDRELLHHSREAADSSFDVSPVDAEPSSRDAYEEVVSSIAFDELLSPLSPKAAKLIRMVYQYKVPQKEAARCLMISEDAAKMMKRRAFQKMKKFISR